MIEPHPIEVESYRIMESLVDLSRWSVPARHVVARMVHATADESLAHDARVGDKAVEAACAALHDASTVVCDSKMVAAGAASISSVRCLLDEVTVAPAGSTRSASAFELAAKRWPDGALWVVGNAPTALATLLRLHASGDVRPAAVIGVPVGYVGAAESKAALWSGPLAPLSITVLGRRGGSPVAAAALNALSRLVQTASVES